MVDLLGLVAHDAGAVEDVFSGAHGDRGDAPVVGRGIERCVERAHGFVLEARESADDGFLAVFARDAQAFQEALAHSKEMLAFQERAGAFGAELQGTCGGFEGLVEQDDVCGEIDGLLAIEIRVAVDHETGLCQRAREMERAPVAVLADRGALS